MERGAGTPAEQPGKRLEDAILDSLSQAFSAAGAELIQKAPTGRSETDLVVQWGATTYALEMKIARQPNAEQLEGVLAATILQARRFAHQINGRPLPVICVERLTDRKLTAIRSYVEQMAPDADWGAIDLRGRRHFSGANLEQLTAPGRTVPRAERASRSSFNLFTDLGQWMAKVLLAPRLDPEMLAAPREQIRNALHLALVADVSAPTSARWVQHMRAQGFIEQADDGLRLVQRRAFFEQWRRALSRPRREIQTRFLLPGKSPTERLNFTVGRETYNAIEPFNPDRPRPYPGAIVWKHGPRMCMGMFEAATGHGVAFVHGAPTHLYLESISEETLRGVDLVQVQRGERSSVVVVEPRYPESTFRASVIAQRRDGNKVPVADVLQTWLEIAEHPARGREDADEIERRIIAPWLLREDARDTAR